MHFGALEMPNSFWDHKRALLRIIGGCVGTDTAGGDDSYLPVPGKTDFSLSHDVWSNIHYGYVGRAFTDSTTMNLVNRNSGTYDAGDEVSVNIGYELADKYPNGSIPDGAVTRAIVNHLPDYINAAAQGAS